ncbi:MAG: hypothetical protein LBR26_15990 [Prevotella sp.]|jgi:hypothetical protein|nr:hypothetical protein [Prevotella sp.]
MKVKKTKNGYTLSGISGKQLYVITYLLGIIREKCFQNGIDDDGDYVSGSDFFAYLDEKELEAFKEFVKDLKQ